MPPVPPSPAPSITTTTRQSMRMKRMQMILQKALEVSVHAASLVDLRACIESECRGDEELLTAFFPPPTPESPEQHNTEEVAAQAVMSLRQKVETLFQWLCETHDVDSELLELEDAIQQAEERQMRRVEKRQEEEDGKEEDRMESSIDADQKQVKTTPEAWIRAERLQAKQEEQKELERLVEDLETKNKELQQVVEEKRRQAVADVQQVQRVAGIILSKWAILLRIMPRLLEVRDEEERKALARIVTLFVCSASMFMLFKFIKLMGVEKVLSSFLKHLTRHCHTLLRSSELSAQLFQ